MQDSHPPFCLTESVARTRQLIAQESFCHRHRAHEKAFTRKRCFTFMTSVLFILQKTIRSVQLHVHSFFDSLGQEVAGLTASAWSQARLKLSYTAFISLNEKSIVTLVYRDRTHPQLRLWKGHRLLA